MGLLPHTIVQVALSSILVLVAHGFAGAGTTQPDQQLMYHGSRVWARRHTPELMLGRVDPELMLGVYSPEEFDEVTLERKPPKPAPNVMLPPHDEQTGEVIDLPSAVVPAPSAPPDEPAPDEAESTDAYLTAEAEKGMAALQTAWKNLSADDQKLHKAALDNRHKPAAQKADAKTPA